MMSDGKSKKSTLIKILIIVLILVTIFFSVYISIKKVKENKKESEHEEIIAELKDAAYLYAKKIDTSSPNTLKKISFADLLDNGYIKNIPIDPLTGKELKGCILFNWNNDKLDFEYDENCEITIKTPKLITMDIKFEEEIKANNNGWHNVDFNVKVKVDGDSFKWCLTTNEECIPINKVNNNNGLINITNESDLNKICVIGYKDIDYSSIVCSSVYKLDKTKPIITGVSNITVAKGATVDLKSGVTASDTLSGILSYGYNPTNVNTTIAGTKVVTYTVTDMAGNVATTTKNIIVNTDKPIVIFSPSKTANSNDWYNSVINITIAALADSASSINKMLWCSTTEETCTPTTTVEDDSVIIPITTNSASNKVCVKATDKTGNTSDTICSNNYKIDLVAPTITGVNNINLEKGLEVNLNSGVTADDTLSGISSYEYSPTNVDTTVAGLKKVTYTVTDMAGNVTTITKSITINTDKPTITFTPSTAVNDKGWYNSEISIAVEATADSTSSINNILWCSTTEETCTPTTTVEDDSVIIPITTNSTSNKICAKATDMTDNVSDIVCSSNYKLDSQTPTITAILDNISIAEGESNLVSSYFNEATYGISGGSISCNPTNTSGLTAGLKSISCTATSNSGLSTTTNKNITVNASLYIDSSGANYPELYENMIPVKYENNNWVYADLSENWYDYDNKNWANAVILINSPSQSYEEGDNILMSDIAMMYVWIPRYKYTMFRNFSTGSTSVQQISIAFENETASTGTVSCTNSLGANGSTASEICTDTTNGSLTNGLSTYTHPAFNFGGTNLKGMWVGKFEISADTSSSCYTNPSVENCNVTNLMLYTKPNIKSWRSASVSTFYTSMLNIASGYGITSGESHMIKNMEWGAVAYLAHSKYGRCTGGTCTEVSKNNSSGIYTGRSLGRPSTAAGEWSLNGTYTYETTEGQLASTTGNIYGIYDMSGGSNEYVMGNMADSNKAFYPSSSEFISAPNSKYYDAYTYSIYNDAQGRGKYGDAAKETISTWGSTSGGWYSDSASFPSSIGSWFVRGNGYANGLEAGMFSYSSSGGGSSDTISSRAVITEIDSD